MTPAKDFNFSGPPYVAHTTVSTNGIVSNGFNWEWPLLNWTNSMPLNVTSFVAVTYSPARGTMKFYINGNRVSSGQAIFPLSGIIDTNNMLGRSQFSADPYFAGRYNEFRIYRGLLSDSDVAADYAAGPDTVGVDYVLHNFAGNNSLTITWGLSVTNLVLKSSPVLGNSATWNPVATTPVLQNGRYVVNVPLTGNAAFFRLQVP